MTQDEFEKCQTYITPVEQETIDTIVKVLGHITWDLSKNGFNIFHEGATYIYALQQARSNLVELKERWIGRMKQNKETEDEQQKIENQTEIH